MDPEKRRRGRRIRKTRRAFRKVAARFGEIGQAAASAAVSIYSFGSAIREAARREEEAAHEEILRAKDAS